MNRASVPPGVGLLDPPDLARPVAAVLALALSIPSCRVADRVEEAPGRSAAIGLTADDRLRRGQRGRFAETPALAINGRAAPQRGSRIGDGGAAPGRVNLIERQRDHRESEAVSSARARLRPVPRCSSLPPLTRHTAGG
jgi:hypothetical protein